MKSSLKSPITPGPVEEESWEEVEEDLNQEEEFWEEVEEEIEEDPEEEEWEENEEVDEEGGGEGEEVEEDPEEDPKAEEREDHKLENFLIQPSQVTEKSIIQKESNSHLLLLDPKPERKELDESDYPQSPLSNFNIMPISSKRPSPEYVEDEEKNSRSSKKAKSNQEEERKDNSLSFPAPVAVGRVWYQEDEIAVLEGLIDYKNKEGEFPPNDMVAFHEFIKWKLYGDISRIQLYEKVKRLKKKFFINLEKADDSIEPPLSKPHDYAIFDLSRRIWGSSMASTSGSDAYVKRRKRKSRKIHNTVKEVEENEDAAAGEVGADDTGDILSKYPYLSESLFQDSPSLGLVDSVKSYVKKKLSLMSSAKAEELEMEWKKVREQEAEIFLKKMNLIAQQTKLILEARKSD